MVRYCSGVRFLVAVVAMVVAVSACSGRAETTIDDGWCVSVFDGVRGMSELFNIGVFDREDAEHLGLYRNGASDAAEVWIETTVTAVENLADLTPPPGLEEDWTAVILRSIPVIAGGPRSSRESAIDPARGEALWDFVRDECGVPDPVAHPVPPELLR
jgi:hypothetical protein